MVILRSCRRNFAESCTCGPCQREADRRRVAADGPLSVIEREEPDDER